MERSQAAPPSGYSRPTWPDYSSSPQDYDIKDPQSSDKKWSKVIGGINEKQYEFPLGYEVEPDINSLPKTGVDYPFLLYWPLFIKTTDEFEACVSPVSP